MSLPSTRPASFRITDDIGTHDVCADCKAALKRKGFLTHPAGHPPLLADTVRTTSIAPDEAVCTWCE